MSIYGPRKDDPFSGVGCAHDVSSYGEVQPLLLEVGALRSISQFSAPCGFTNSKPSLLHEQGRHGAFMSSYCGGLDEHRLT